MVNVPIIYSLAVSSYPLLYKFIEERQWIAIKVYSGINQRVLAPSFPHHTKMVTLHK